MNRHFTNDQQTYDKAFNFLSHSSKCKLKPQCSPHPPTLHYQDGTHPGLSPYCESVNWYSHLSYGQYELNPWSSNSIPRSMPIRNTYVHQKTCEQCSQLHYISPNPEIVHLQENGHTSNENKPPIVTHTTWINLTNILQNGEQVSHKIKYTEWFHLCKA